ncbi:hypothetical protein EON66_07020 [archaeon]|nr:MAG: hypothetical protein EON66_07020 [archaeon]
MTILQSPRVQPIPSSAYIQDALEDGVVLSPRANPIAAPARAPHPRPHNAAHVMLDMVPII